MINVATTEGSLLEDRIGSRGEYPSLKEKLMISTIKEKLGKFVSDDGETPLYETDRLTAKISLLPSYVLEATYNRFNEVLADGAYEKIFLDKWGKRDIESKRYIETPEIVFYRAARLAAKGFSERDSSVNEEELTKEIFGRFVNREIFPNTPYMANGGHRLIARELLERLDSSGLEEEALRNDLMQELKVREQIFACFVLPLYDSRQSILRETLPDAADIQASIGGTGFNFSNLRPANEAIAGTGGTTDGPVKFMAAYSTVLGTTMNQGGKREGANMFMLNWNHPDVMRFIHSKSDDGEIPAANISVAIDHDFMAAVRAEGEERFYPLVNPHYNPEIRPHIPRHYTLKQLQQAVGVSAGNKKTKTSMLLDKDGTTILSPWLPKGMDEEYKKIGKIKEGVVYLDAKRVMKHIAYMAWSNGEPGGIMVGHINDANPTHPRHYQAYLLEESDDEAREVINKLRAEHPGADLESLVEEYVNYKDEDGRRVNLPIGVGIMDATNPCGEKPLLPHEACDLGHTNVETLLEEDSSVTSGYSVNRDRFRGSIDLLVGMLDNAIDQNMFTNTQIEQTQKSNRKIGLGIMGLGRMLYKLELGYHTQEARDFVDDLLQFWEEESDRVSFERGEKFGAFPNFRYSHHRHGKPKRNAITRTLAPTGTTSFIARTSGGMEPEFALAYTRTTVQGTEITILNEILQEKMKKYPFLADDEVHSFLEYVGARGSLQEFEISRRQNERTDYFSKRKENLARIKRIFVTSYDISPEDQVRMEGVVQKHVDDAISKTINFRNNATPEDVEKIFHLADELKIKGVTLYRDGTRKGQPLVAGVAGTQERDTKRITRKELSDLVMSQIRKPRPRGIKGGTEEIPTPFGDAFITYNYEFENGARYPYESFINIGKAGGDVPAISEGFGRLISMALKAGIYPDYIISQLEEISGETQSGLGPQKVKSLPDGIAKGIRRILELDGDKVESNGKNNSGNLCPNCGVPLAMQEGCLKCLACGFSKC